MFKNQRELTVAITKSEQLRSSVSWKFCDHCARRFNSIKKNAEERQKVFLFRVFLADFLIIYAACRNAPVLKITKDFLGGLQDRGCPIDPLDFKDRANDYTSNEALKAVDDYFHIICERRGIDPVIPSPDNTASWMEAKETAIAASRLEFEDRCEEMGLSIIRSYMLKNLIREAKYPFLDEDFDTGLAMLKDWIKEAKVPRLNEIDISKPELTAYEIATLARSGLLKSAPMSKRGIRKKMARNVENSRNRLSLSSELAELRNYYIIYNKLPTPTILEGHAVFLGGTNL